MSTAMDTERAQLRAERGTQVRRVLYTILGVSVVLGAGKAVAGWTTGSLSVMGGAIDSGVDTLTTLVALALTRVASQGPDEKHPYGHAKFEAVGALAIVAFLSITVFELIRGAVARIREPQTEAVDTYVALAAMVASLAIGWLASAYERRRGTELRSDILLADAAHLRADVYVTVAVIAGLVLTRFGFPTADAWMTLLVALLIAHTGWEIISEAVPVLVDERAVEEGEIRDRALSCGGVRAVYDVRSRGRQGEVFAELTIAVNDRLDVGEAHAIADAVERTLTDQLGAREVVVHVEPISQRQGIQG
ncbi:MAG: cation transporter [Gemmatimonadetes bacterium]|nr:cation transporter [Gemmatimonadota bacterium]